MQALVDRSEASEPRVCDAGLVALDHALGEIAALVASIGPEAYRARPLPDASGSIGEHVRHCLDHVSALVAATPSSGLSYDRRERGTTLEKNPAAALRAIQILRIKVAVGRWSMWGHEPIAVSSMVSSHGAMVTGLSTLARELAFVLNHTIHHQATMALLASLQRFDVPSGFGYAPSTPRPAARAFQCAR